MTPTRSQLDAALPRVPSGIGAMSGDLTDPDERAVALDWLERLVAEAFPIPVEEGRDGMVTFRGVGFYLSEPEPVSTDPIDDEDDTDEQADGVENTIDWLTSLRQSRETASTRDRLQSIADYFHERAVEASDITTHLPD